MRSPPIVYRARSVSHVAGDPRWNMEIVLPFLNSFITLPCVTRLKTRCNFGMDSIWWAARSMRQYSISSVILEPLRIRSAWSCWTHFHGALWDSNSDNHAARRDTMPNNRTIRYLRVWLERIFHFSQPHHDRGSIILLLNCAEHENSWRVGDGGVICV